MTRWRFDGALNSTKISSHHARRQKRLRGRLRPKPGAVSYDSEGERKPNGSWRSIYEGGFGAGAGVRKICRNVFELFRR